ncbi:conserved protein of unknown function [Modestobacter italicus]|uniref:Membrane protein of uknown function UCP014873 n=1 Tax=Modestobacter italicus (strain DSM 44449 / CECT 9708 / BC 501) TaxID=2732864 RepID=I4EYM2_MODI5|nr:DUF1269 domain-containing protein [Modestobacter marinus]CCH88485.1 conserved protein of unknown function [Modestobacter marinus]
MADLVVLGFSNRRAAEEVFDLGQKRDREGLVDLDDAALVWRDERGRVRVQQSIGTTAVGAGFGAASGALWGTLLGLLIMNPLAGLAIGGLTGGSIGAASGALSDIGIDDDLIRQVGEQLQPGKAAVFVLARGSTPVQLTEALKSYAPTVLQTSLTADREADLVRALQS